MPDFLTMYITFFVFLIGICIGSFLNVVILRGLVGESIVFPPSKCPKCNAPLKWWHNIPLLSFILLKGKCYYCHEKISWQYFIVELLTGCLFVWSYYKFGYSMPTIVMWGILSMFVVMTVTDIKEKVIFDMHSIVLVVLGIIFSMLNHNLLNSVLGILEGVLIMEALAAVGHLFVKSRAFGVGDTFIAAALGAIFGWNALIIVLLWAVIIQAVMTLPLFFRKLYINKEFKTMLSLSLFFVVAILYRVVTLNPDINIRIVYFFTFMVVFSGLYATRQITKGMKSAKDAIVLPFGPAMFIAAFIFLVLN